MSRHTMGDGGVLDINVHFLGPLSDALHRHASARGVRPEALLAQVVERTLRDDLVGAILDDGK